ncbi:toxin YhaV [Luteibacter sp. OK325]|uniref:type II toxin-antitoxin system YhaV family toxin n=1 Tax=Luteibacter sp. OK325 TaxID=2135670 RepID=UPI000D399B33|nr:type II toxin-antitoxin system YhaV family toxin [Luteibacter sp. OK325]PTR35106.1 toxin YhaV [Luteibacter sp. OK325]
MQVDGWTLLFHECIVEQLSRLHSAALRAERQDPAGFEGNANVRLFRALSHLLLHAVPGDPSREEYRQGNTLGTAHRHWRRAKLGRRFRVFFRFDSRSRVIVYAWVNDEGTLRSSGSRSDAYAVFTKMLGRGNPPTDWDALVSESATGWKGPHRVNDRPEG